MGNTRLINTTTGLRNSQFETIMSKPKLNMKLIEPKANTNFHIDNSPLFSNTSKYYAIINEHNKIVKYLYMTTKHI